MTDGIEIGRHAGAALPMPLDPAPEDRLDDALLDRIIEELSRETTLP